MHMYCPTWSTVPHLSLLYNAGRSAERLCEGELCCVEHRRKVNALCLLYKIYHRADHPLHEYFIYIILLQLVILEVQLL